MNDLLNLIGQRNTEKIISHPKFPGGLNELIRQGYVVVKDEKFLLTVKGENARKTGIQPEEGVKDEAQTRRFELNKSITDLPQITTPLSHKSKRSVFFIILTFFIFFINFLSNPKIFKAKNKNKVPGK